MAGRPSMRSGTLETTVHTAARSTFAFVLAASVAARAEDAPPRASAPRAETSAAAAPAVAATAPRLVAQVGFQGDGLAGVISSLFFFGAEVAALSQAAAPVPVESLGEAPPDASSSPAPLAYRRSYRDREARQGFLFSFGLGAGSMNITNPSLGRTGAFDLDFRMGWGFSDRFQLFVDFDDTVGHYANNSFSGDVSSWTLTFRGQTVLLGDRAGNGLNLNLGLGLGGLTFSNDAYGYSYSSTPASLAIAGGLSYDFRVGRNFAISPEFFVSWHQAAIDPRGEDAVRTIGGRLNFLWYL